MDNAIKIQQEMALEKYGSLNVVDKRRIDLEVDRLAKGRGYFNAEEMKAQKPYIWSEMCAQAVGRLFP